MTTLALRPQRGGFVRAFGCGLFIRDFLLGIGPHGSPRINPEIGDYQANIFYHYKIAIIKATALDRATRQEEKKAHGEKRPINPDNIDEIARNYQARMPYKAQGCRYHSFVVYFSNLIRLGWVEFTGKEEASEFQEHYSQGQPRKYYRLTIAGRAASDAAWANPRLALYG